MTLGLVLVLALAVAWGVGTALVSLAPAADLDAVKGLAGDRTSALTSLAHIVSALGSGYVVFALAALGCAWLVRRRRVRAALALVVSTMGGVIISNLDKVLVRRARPPVHHLEHVTSSSFPSGHATQSAALYLALLILVLRCRPRSPAVVVGTVATVMLVLAIAVSRVYLGVHYPSDVTAGLMLGATWAAVTTGLILPRRSATICQDEGPERRR